MLSIVVCTYNRSYLLHEQIACLSQLQPPVNKAVEIIYINNNSTDDTAAVLQAISKNCGYSVRVFHEDKQGLSHARNRGWQEALGEYVIYLDDDAFPETNWLVNYAAALDQWRPQVAGGPIVPFFKQAIPSWMDIESAELNGYLGRLDLGNETRWLQEDEDVWGGNIAFARSALQKAGGFNPNLGMNGKQRFGGEESELQRRICGSEKKVLFIHNAPVNHLIIDEKRRLSYFLKHSYNRGASYVRMKRIEQDGKNLSWPRKMVFLLGHAKDALIMGVRGKPAISAIHWQEASGYAGQIVEILFGKPSTKLSQGNSCSPTTLAAHGKDNI